MASERDLSDLLPPSPPPRPDRRERAIGAALRRFDGVPDVVADASAAPRRWRLGRMPQLGMLAAAALVAAVGLPLWLSGEHQPPGMSRQPVTRDAPHAIVALSQREERAEPPAAVVAKPAPPIAPPSLAVHSASPVATLAEKSDVAASSTAPAPAPAPMNVAPSRAELAAAPPPPPAAMVKTEEAIESSADVVVTGTRVTRHAKERQRIEQRLAQPGDWNRCTIDDPRRDVDACRPPARAAAAGAAAQAAALVGDGLAAAWRDDLTAATAAFDRALVLSPRLAAAWLNRGLVKAKQGDDAEALADLDKAVRYAPHTARGWFQRSLILRRQDKPSRADDDAGRAVELDQRYAELIE